MRTPIAYFLIVSAMLFSIGTVGVLVRKNALIIFMSIELQLNAVNLALVTFSRMHDSLNGQVLAFFSMARAWRRSASMSVRSRPGPSRARSLLSVGIAANVLEPISFCSTMSVK